MIHRALHSFAWGSDIEKDHSEPNDLPNILHEDMLIIVPVNPLTLFTTWHISYPTQNHLLDIIGEKQYRSSRLLLRLEAMHNGQTQDVDVSGPIRSQYVTLALQLPPFPHALKLIGRIGYEDQEGNFFAVTQSNLTRIPRNTLSGSIFHRKVLEQRQLHSQGIYNEDQEEEIPCDPSVEIYDRLHRRLEAHSATSKQLLSSTWLAQRTDELWGRPHRSAKQRFKDKE